MSRPRFRLAGAAILAFTVLFLTLTIPLAFERPSGGRSGERQGQTAGMIRIYCEKPDRFFLKSPMLLFGDRPFNLELSVFEWAQGAVARVIDGPECDSVETVAKLVSIGVSALAVSGAGLLAALLLSLLSGAASGQARRPEGLGPVIAASSAAALVATDDLWLRYATYTMIENRVIVCGIWAVYFSLKRRHWPAFLLWSLTLLQKPQVFSFAATFWGMAELMTGGLGILKESRGRKIVAGVATSLLLGGLYFGWSTGINKQSDLPWVMWTGPTVEKWYFGSWAERFTFAYTKSQVLDWIHKNGLFVVIPLLLIFARSQLRTVLLLSLPYFVGRLAYTFIFHHTFQFHEYSALPLNLGGFVSLGAILGVLASAALFDQKPWWRQAAKPALLLGACLLVAVPAVAGLRTYLRFASEVNDPAAFHYFKDWNRQLFPEKHVLVAIAGPNDARDILTLYHTKQRGFMWCASNVKFAPRAFWKSEGVKYVAWAEEINRATGEIRWVVRTIEEELARARANGWSSDTDDAWAGRTMTDWAALSSSTFQDPCTGRTRDPRQWNHP